MTRIRHYETGTPFGEWLRSQRDLPSTPSPDCEVGFIATDIDLVVHRWFHGSTGKHIQCLMVVEVKTRGAQPRFAQLESLSALQLFSAKKNIRLALPTIHPETREMIPDFRQYRFYGVHFLLLSGTSPEDSDSMVWARWKWKPHGVDHQMTASQLQRTKINIEQLKGILRWDLHPSTLKPFKPFKKHHGFREIDQEIVTPLGFETMERTIKRW